MDAETIQSQLIEVKRAITDLDWFRCQELTEQIVPSLPVEEAISIGVHQAELCLLGFERRHPDIRWSRTLISLLQQRDPAAYSLAFLPWPEEINPIDTSLLNGLEMLTNAAEAHNNPEVATWRVWKAIQWSIGARRFEYYAGEFPEDWKICLLSAAGETNVPPLKSQYLAEPKIQDFTANLWRSFVQDLESRLPV